MKNEKILLVWKGRHFQICAQGVCSTWINFEHKLLYYSHEVDGQFNYKNRSKKLTQTQTAGLFFGSTEPGNQLGMTRCFANTDKVGA